MREGRKEGGGKGGGMDTQELLCELLAESRIVSASDHGKLLLQLCDLVHKILQ